MGVSVDDRSVTSEEYNSCDQFLSSVDATFVGWTLCTRDELRNDPQKALEVSNSESLILQNHHYDIIYIGILGVDY